MNIKNCIEVLKEMEEYKRINVLIRHSRNSVERNKYEHIYNAISFAIKILEKLDKKK